MPEAKIVAPAIADYIQLPHFFLDHLILAKSASYENLPPDHTNGPYPLLIFSHGWNGFRQQSTFLMQELASHGYVVVALEHPYGSRLTVFPDGSIIPNNPAALPKNLPTEQYEAAARILVNQWAGDIGYTLDYLTGLNKSDPDNNFTNLLAGDKIGVFGHSTGGGAAIQFCGTDPRCKAGLTLDAFTRPIGLDVLDNGTKQPFFYMFSELWPFERNTKLFNRYYSHVDPSNHVVTILGTDHYDFSDLPALSPLAPQLGLKGPINATRVQQIIDSYVLAYFDKQFKDIPSTLFDGPQTAYPEVRYDH
jgi:pimeloyl-ACP methyl ester carboxylesterase